MIQTMDEPDEQLDLVDANDQPIGVISREEVLQLEADGRGFTRAVGVFIINSRGELWVPRRGQHKKIAPGGLDFSAGEHVHRGEPYHDAAVRGLQEELRIQPDQAKLSLTGKLPPFAGIPYFHEIFLYHSNEIPTYNRNDYDSYEWLTPSVLAARLEAGEPAKEVLLPSVQLIVQMQAKQVKGASA